jgi:hypothetical protein
VNRFASQAGPAALLVKATGRESRLDPFRPWINRRWNEGLTSAAALHAEMTATQGWTGSVQAVERYVRQFRTADGRTRAGRAARPVPAATLVPKTRQITRWLLSRPASLDPGEHAQLDGIRLASRAVLEGLEGFTGGVVVGIDADAVAVELLPHGCEHGADHQADVPLVQVLGHLGQDRGRGVVDVVDGGAVEFETVDVMRVADGKSPSTGASRIS